MVLHTLHLAIPQNSSNTNKQPDLCQTFPSLRYLIIESDFRTMISLVEAVQSTTLDTLSLTIVHGDDREMVLGELIALISLKRGWESSLKTIIIINRSGLNLVVDEYSGPGHPYFLSVEDLLVFSRLQHITLDRLVILLNDTLCEKLAAGWPCLVEFCFNRTSARGLVPVGLSSLVAFARHCPQLSRLQLGVPWDMTAIPVLDDATLTILSSRPTRSTCMLISVGHLSVITNPKAVARFLATMFPRREIKIVLVATPNCFWYFGDGWFKVVFWLSKTQPGSLELGTI